MIRTRQIIDELFARNRSAVYVRHRRGRPGVALAGSLENQLGLTLMLEHELHGGAEPWRVGRDADGAAESAWRAGQLAMLTTSELLAPLHRQPGAWVLGLVRNSPTGGRRQCATFYGGDRVLCAGLAGYLGWMLARRFLRKRRVDTDAAPEPGELIDEMLGMMSMLNQEGCPQAGFAMGMPILLEHALRATLKSTP